MRMKPYPQAHTLPPGAAQGSMGHPARPLFAQRARTVLGLFKLRIGFMIMLTALVGTVFTLFVVPMFYSLISRSDASYVLHRKTVEQTFGPG